MRKATYENLVVRDMKKMEKKKKLKLQQESPSEGSVI